jgi:hypothetical protein
MSVVACEVPAGGALGRDAIARADFRDAYRVALRRPGRDVVDLFFAIFTDRPAWMTALLVARNRAAALAGLAVPTTAEITDARRRDRYAVGDKIGPWPIFFLGPDELVAGRDNKHMDFRVSIRALRDDAGAPAVVVSTVCHVRNAFGRAYLAAVIPFHKFGLRTLLARAVAAGRL